MPTEFLDELVGLLELAEEGDYTKEDVISAVYQLIHVYADPKGDCCG